MQLVLAALALAALIATPVLAQEAPVVSDETIAQILADRIDRDGQGVGIAAAVIENGTPRFFNHGTLAKDGDTPVSETTLFEAGSLAKLFTNLLVAQLVLEGKMALDAPVSDYLPEGTKIPAFERKAITLFDLATHSSGLPSVPPELAFADAANPYRHYNAALLYGFLAAYPLPRAPGTEYEYSNIGTSLLGEAVSHVTGIAYGELVQQRILDPLGMTETMLVVPDAMAARFATGHDQAGQPVSHWDFDVFAPAGGWRSTVADLAKFAAAASGQVESPLKDAVALMLKETRPAGSPNMTIGLGWIVLDHEGGSIIWHNGMTGGFNAFLGFDSATGRAAVVLANAATATGIEDIGFHLIDATAPLAPQSKPREAITLDPAMLENYVGTYELGPEFSIAITTEGPRLFVQASGQDRLEAFAETETDFFLRIVDAQISFEVGPDGKATGLVLHQNGQDMPGSRQ